MALNRQQLEQGSTNNGGSESNTAPIDEPEGVSALTRGAVEVMVIQTLQRYIEPILEPLIRRVVKEVTGLAQQKQFTSMKENNPVNTRSSSAPRKLKLQFRNKISQPVLTGKELLGENQEPIEIALVDAITGQIVETGTESTAKLEIVLLRVGDDEGDVDSLTLEELQKRAVSEKHGKKRILQGDTTVRLKGGVGFVGKISFTHGSKWAMSGWYRLGARVVDADVMTGVEVAYTCTEAFLMKDRRSVLYEKHHPPSLLDKVYHLEQISFKGVYCQRLRLAEVNTVKDLLTLVYTNPKKLENILELKASSKVWGDIVNHAQTSDEVFLCLDSNSEEKTGVALDVKLQLIGLIVEPNQYIPVHQLSDQQKVDSRDLEKFASKNFDLLHYFKDEASLVEFLKSKVSLANHKIDGPPSPSSQATYSSFDPVEGPENWDNSNSQMGTSSQANKPPFGTYEHTNSFNDRPIYTPEFDIEEYLYHSINYDSNELYYDPASFDPDIMIMAAQTVSVCSAQTRWTKVSKLLRRLSVRERISPREGAEAQKKQRCF